VLAKRCDHVHLARIVFVSWGLPVEQGRETARFEQPGQRSFDALRLISGLTPPRAQPTQVVDRSRAVVLQTDDPRQLNQCRAELQHRPFVEVRPQTRHVTLELR
jgi:hypothetical protein